MTCGGCGGIFENTLHYSSPAHGGWGVVRMGHLMPESYQLFVSPAACGRHGAIGACMQGRKNRVSYLYLSEEDIVSGDYEDLILEAAGELLDCLEKRGRKPKVLMIFVSCIDDLLGTDHNSLLGVLKERYPDIRFDFCHMNPISLDTKVPPPVNIRDKLYGFLDVSREKDEGVNLLGSLVPLLPESEIFKVLGQMGAEPIRHISDFGSFFDFQQMAKSKLNLVIAPPGKYAAQNLEKRLGIPFHMSLTTYDPALATKAYGELADLLEVPCPDLSSYEERCEKAMEETCRHLSGLPIVIDDDAVFRPFDLCRALLKRGFQVKRVLTQKVIPLDREAYEWVVQHKPDLEIMQPQHHKAMQLRAAMTDCLAIGYNCAYQTGASHIVPCDGQMGHWGYYGILEMMRLILEAYEENRDLEKLVRDAGLVV